MSSRNVSSNQQISQQEQNELLTLIELVDAAELIESSKRKPAMYGNLTFYGGDDQWLFQAYHTAPAATNRFKGSCDECRSYDGETFYGNDLRGFFRWHIIVDENNIYAKVHPHCNCSLTRLTFVSGFFADYFGFKVTANKPIPDFKQLASQHIPKSVLDAVKKAILLEHKRRTLYG
jgi:hypothetical protein